MVFILDTKSISLDPTCHCHLYSASNVGNATWTKTHSIWDLQYALYGTCSALYWACKYNSLDLVMLREEWMLMHAARLCLWGLVKWNYCFQSQDIQPAPVTCKVETCILCHSNSSISSISSISSNSSISSFSQPYLQYLKHRLNVFYEILLFTVFIYFQLLIS